LTTKEARSRPAPSLRAGTEIEIGFTDLLANGQAVGRAGGMVVFCFGPLPQERALVRIAAIKQKYAVGDMLELLVASPERATPFCKVFGICGGCQVQHLSYTGQLAWKRTVVRNALERIGGFAGIDVLEPIGMAEPRNYRNKMSLVVEHATGSRPQAGDEKIAPTLGFYQQRSHDVVAIDECPIVAPQLNEYIAVLNRARKEEATAPAFFDARHLVARSARATGQGVLTITSAEASKSADRAAPALFKLLPNAVGITNSFDLTSENAIMGRRQNVLVGEAAIEEEMEGVRYRVSGESFFQVNVEIVQRIFDFIRPELTCPQAIVDLYCGAGTFSLFFAKHGSTVFGIEESAQAIAEAQANADLNGMQSSVHFRAGRVEEAVRMPDARAALRDAEIVFLDPPRKGSDERTLGAIAAAGAPRIWYLSCDPATLARDLKFLAANGYQLELVQPFDMFPQTGHIEALAMLRCTGEAAGYGDGRAA